MVEYAEGLGGARVAVRREEGEGGRDDLESGLRDSGGKAGGDRDAGAGKVRLGPEFLKSAEPRWSPDGIEEPTSVTDLRGVRRLIHSAAPSAEGFTTARAWKHIISDAHWLLGAAFHSFTLVGDQIIIVGCLGYPDDRRPGHTPVYALDPTGYGISKDQTTGEARGWVFEHEAEADSDGVITIRGGEVMEDQDGERRFRRNVEEYALDTRSGGTGFASALPPWGLSTGGQLIAGARAIRHAFREGQLAGRMRCGRSPQ